MYMYIFFIHIYMYIFLHIYMYIFFSTYMYVHIFFSSFSVPFFYLCSSFVFLFSTPLWKKEKNYCVEERKKKLCYIHTNILFLICFSSFNASATTALCVFFSLFFSFSPSSICVPALARSRNTCCTFFFLFSFSFFPLFCVLCPFRGQKSCTIHGSYARNVFFSSFFFVFFHGKSAAHIGARMHGMTSFYFSFFS